MSWLESALNLKNKGIPFVVITLTQVRGHTPRGAGSKMLVSKKDTYGSIGGGNLEQSTIKKARALLAKKVQTPEQFTLKLNPKGGEFGIQCCGGDVTVLLEPIMKSKTNLAIFGAGHVGWAVIHVLSPFPIDIYLVDSREKQLEPPKNILLNPTAKLHTQHAPIPETALQDLPKNSHILVMTHDHAEDLAILDVALKRQNDSFLGLIGSNVKWMHFQEQLQSQGYSKQDLARITTPIGLKDVKGKNPQAIAVAVSAQLLSYLDFTEGDF